MSRRTNNFFLFIVLKLQNKFNVNVGTLRIIKPILDKTFAGNCIQNTKLREILFQNFCSVHLKSYGCIQIINNKSNICKDIANMNELAENQIGYIKTLKFDDIEIL